MNDDFGLTQIYEGYAKITGMNDPKTSWTLGYAGIIGFMFEIIAALAVIMLVWAGYQYLTAYGDEEKAGKAKKTILYSLLGVVISLSAFTLIKMLGTLIK